MKTKLFSTAIRNISACFFCFGGMQGDFDCLQPANELEFPRRSQVCQFPLIRLDILEALPPRAVHLLHPLLREGCFPSPIDRVIQCNPFVAAASEGNLEILKLLFKKASEGACFFEQEIIDWACLFASAHGHREVLRFLFTKVIPESFFFIEPEVLDCCCIFAAANGHSKTLKFLLKKAFPKCFCFITCELLNSCSVCAAANGHAEILKFLFTKAFPKNMCLIAKNDLKKETR